MPTKRRDTMDFSRYGVSGKEWNNWAAFSNAALRVGQKHLEHSSMLEKR